MKSVHGCTTNSATHQRFHRLRKVHSDHQRCLRARASFKQLGTGAWVVHGDKQQVPKGVCHFLGGAFAGAAPQAVYNLFLELLADDGYTIITTPYHITFRHAECAELVYQSFNDSLEELRGSGRGALVPGDVPLFGIGHSNGALLHLLMGSLLDTAYTSNVVISYNNRQVSDAIPIPGFLEGLGPAVQAARQLPVPAPFTLPEVALSVTRGVATSVPRSVLPEDVLLGATPAIEQLGTVVGEVGDGTTDFTPSPSASRQIIREGYSVPSTLLIQFLDDSIDETSEMAALLREANPRGTYEVILPGSHITPVGVDVRWQVQGSFTPWDAFAMAAKAGAQRDIRRLVSRVAGWLDVQAAEKDAKPAEQVMEKEGVSTAV